MKPNPDPLYHQEPEEWEEYTCSDGLGCARGTIACLSIEAAFALGLLLGWLADRLWLTWRVLG